MGVRQLQKERTRQAFMQAALDMVADDRSFTSISLREITAKVGVVPTAFYRHFADLDCLGVAIVSEVLPALRQELKLRRQKIRDSVSLVETSVNTYFDYVLARRKEFLFCGREITGGSRKIRSALRLEIFAFSRELAADISHIPPVRGLDDDDIFAIADLMVRAILTTAQDLAGISQYPEAVETLRLRTIKQIKMVVIGAEHWPRRAVPARS